MTTDAAKPVQARKKRQAPVVQALQDAVEIGVIVYSGGRMRVIFGLVEYFGSKVFGL